jgi:uncharacterized protein (TIGR03435 family)
MLHKLFIAFSALGFAEGDVAAQQAPGPRFEVASIRPNPKGSPFTAPGSTPFQPGGHYFYPSSAVLFMIVDAYEIKQHSITLAGLPEWAQFQLFSVDARGPASDRERSPAENQVQVRLMLRALLEERFHLQMHTEIRDQTVLRLEVAKEGIQLKESSSPVPPEALGESSSAIGNSGGGITGSQLKMESLAEILAGYLKRPVIDATGLNGHYDFEIRWKAAVGETAAPGLSEEGISLLMANLQEQFGVRLTSGKAPVKYWVVDHVDPPTGN